MALVEVEAAKDFVRQVTQPSAQVIAGGLGAAEQRSDAQRLGQLPSRDLGGGLDFGISGEPDARLRAESRAVRRDEVPQRTEVGEDLAGQIQRGAPGRTGA